jgi:2-hydroxychromene-2-carboxylate isomerase
VSKLARLLSPFVSSAITSHRTRDLRRGLAERRRRRRGERHKVAYFHQIDDPYSHLAVQVLPRLVAQYDIDLEPHLVAPPPDDAAPDRPRLIEYSRKDAADIASAYGLEFGSDWRQPDPEFEELLLRLFAGAIRNDVFVGKATALSRAMWMGDTVEVDRAAGGLASYDIEPAWTLLKEGTHLRARLGHYLGGMFYYAGEWYWGVDRLSHLEQRLTDLGAVRARAPEAASRPIVQRPSASASVALATGHERVQLEFYLSLRSPYSYISIERVLALAERLPIDITFRPVLPMVMRGMKVPRNKRMYITRDTKREADDVGVAFGKICDPVGEPVERAFSLYPYACAQGKAGAFLLSFSRAAFADGVNTAKDSGLRMVVERAGLSWREAKKNLGDDAWRGELETNREAMLDTGLWGVPSFRIVGDAARSDFCTWGQDRIWLLEREIRRRTGLSEQL